MRASGHIKKSDFSEEVRLLKRGKNKRHGDRSPCLEVSSGNSLASQVTQGSMVVRPAAATGAGKEKARDTRGCMIAQEPR